MIGSTDLGGERVAALALHSVTKVYDGNVLAVDGVDLAVRDREFLTILGPSGSGKTTTLRLIAGFTSPTSGVIEIGGRDVSGTPSHKRNLGMVFHKGRNPCHKTRILEDRRRGNVETAGRVGAFVTDQPKAFFRRTQHRLRR